MTQESKAPLSSGHQLAISVKVRRGGGRAAFFADVTLNNAVIIPDWPVWNGGEGVLQPALPNKLGKDGKRHPTIRMRQDLLEQVFRNIREACLAGQ